MILKRLMDEVEYESMEREVKFLIVSGHNTDVSRYIASTLRRHTGSEGELGVELERADLILYEGGEWEEAHESICRIIKSFFLESKIESRVEYKDRPYDLLWHSCENYLRWYDENL